MPPKKGTKGGKKKAAPRESEEESITPIDVQYNPEIINGLLTDLGAQVDAKCVLIKKDIDFMATSIKQAFHLELIKLPTQVKQMSIARFKLEFGDSLEAVTRGAMEGNKHQTSKGANSNNNVLMTATKSTRTQSKVFQTPVSGKNFVCETPVTTRAARAAREGEMMLSSNGSPLGEFSTVVKAPRENSTIIPATPGAVCVPLDSGDVVNLENVTELPDEFKQEALTKMQDMMKNMQSMMAKLAQK